jgi:hypothetical protein
MADIIKYFRSATYLSGPTSKVQGPRSNKYNSLINE